MGRSGDSVIHLGRPSLRTGTLPEEIVVLLVIVVLGLALRTAGITEQSLTVDELYDLGIARRPAAEIITAQDRFPPLYHLCLHAWLKCCGDPHTARWLSVAFSLLALPLVYAIARQVGGVAAARSAAFLLAISPLQCYYSQEMRAYSLTFLWAALTIYVYLQCVYAGRRLWWLLVVATLGGIYSHYYFPLVPLALLVTSLLQRPEQRVWRPLTFCVLIVGLLSIPAGLLLKHDLDYPWGHSSESGFGVLALGYTAFAFFAGHGLGPSTRELHVIGGSAALQQFAPWLLVWGALALPLTVRGFTELRKTAYRWTIVLLTVAPVVAIGGLSAVGNFGYNIRHTLWALVPLSVWLGMGLASWGFLTRFGIALGIFLLSCLSINQRAYVEAYQNEDARRAASYLEAAVRDRDSRTVFVCSHYIDAPVRYYLDDSWQVIPVPDVEGEEQKRQDTLALVEKHTTPGRGYWLVYSRPFHGDPEGVLPGWLGLDRIAPIAHFAGIELYYHPAAKRSAQTE